MIKPRLLCIGHRGAMGHAPENTLRSIAVALELGVRCVEIDVYYVDKHLLVFHDDRLERTTNGVGELCDQSFDYLRTLDAGDGQQIPTLEEVCAVIKSKACLNVELKGLATAEPVARMILKYLDAGWDIESFLISSFDRDELLIMRSLIPSIKIGVLIEGSPVDDLTFAAKLAAFSVNPSLDFVTPAFVQAAHDSCLNVYVYTADSSEDVAKVYRSGADGVFTGFPEIVLENYIQGNVLNRWCER